MISSWVLRAMRRGTWLATTTTLLLAILPALVSAQVSVTASAGTASATYTTLAAAFTAINAGTHQGVIGISITANTTEPAAGAILNASGGTSSYTQVTVSPSAAVVRTIQGPISTAQSLVKLFGASNVTIDGRFAGSGQFLRFRIITTTGANSGPTITFDNGATNDVLRNCIVESRATTAFNRGEISLGTAGLTVNNITITGNDLRDMTVDNLGQPANLIVGNSANISAITISNNTMHNFLFSAVNLGGWSNSSNAVGSNISITGNSVYMDLASAPTVQGGFCVFGIGGTGDGHVISGNYIGGKAPLCGGAAWPFSFASNTNTVWAISVRAPGEVVGTSIQGNTIQNIAFGGIVQSFYGINTGATSAPYGKYMIGTVTGNTIGHLSNANSLTFVQASQAPAILPIIASGDYEDIRNNVIANISGSNAGTGVDPFIRGISMTPQSGAAGTFTVENNTLKNLSFPGNSGNGNSSAGIVMASIAITPAITYDVGGIAGNTLSNLTFGTPGLNPGLNYGIYVATSATTSQVVSNNVVSGITGVLPFYGIALSAPNSVSSSIQQNTVQGVALSTAAGNELNGIYASGGTGAIQRNRVWNLTTTSTSASAVIRGVDQVGGTWTLANNEVSLTNDGNTNPVQVLGIVQNNSASGAGSLYYNSVYVGGSQSGGTAGSYAFLRQGSYTDVLTDNLFYNERSGGSGGHYAVGNALAGGWTSDHNALVVADPAKLGQWTGVDEAFAPWQGASAGDAASLGETAANVPSAQLFTDPANGVLDIKPTSSYDVPPLVSNVGVPVGGITTDFGGVTTRNASFPDIGANEITVSRALTTVGNLGPATATYRGNYDDLTVSGGGAPNLTGNVDVFGVLSLGGGNVTTSAFLVTIRPTGSVTRTQGHVVGNLRKYVPTGAGVARTFEIGTGGEYAPADLQFSSVGTAGYFDATTIGTDHPNLASSGLNPAKGANRFWTISNVGTGFTTADATLHFVPGDLDAGANPASFHVAKFDSPNWSMPTTGALTSTSTQATGLTSFSDFAVGELPGYTLTYTAGPNGSISGTTPQTVSPGGSGTQVTAVPNAGYHFVSWSDGLLTASRTDTNVNSNLSVTATFAIDSFTLTYAAGPNGSISGNASQSVTPGEDGTTVTAVPNAGYHFVSWSDGLLTPSRTETDVHANLSVTATFAINTFTLTYTAGPNGSISGTSPQTVPYGSDGAPVTAVPDPGYVFTGWSDAVATASRTETNVTADLSVTASFVAGNAISIAAPAACITPAHSCATVPVQINRTDTTPVLGFSVTFTLSPELALCTPGPAIAEGDYLNTGGRPTNFQVTHLPDGSYRADGVVLGPQNCGPSAASGTLFNVRVTNSGGSGTGTITVTSVIMRDCTNGVIASTIGAPASITLDTNPVAVTPISSPQTVAEQGMLTLNPVVTISGCATGPVTWSINPALPAGATFDTNSGMISWTPGCAAAEGGTAGTYGPFALTATAASGDAGSTSFSIHVTDTPGTVAVTVTPDPQVVAETQLLTVTPALAVGGCATGLTPVWSVSPALPLGALLNTGDGVITWTPACGKAGSYGPFTLKATVVDGSETYEGSATFGISVSHLAGSVAVTVGGSFSVEEESVLAMAAPSAELTACAASPVTWSVLPALPSGATLDPATGVVSWTPTCGQANTYGPFTLKAHASTGEEGTGSFNLTVTHKVGTVTVAAIATPQNVAEMATLTITPGVTLTSCATGPVAWTISPPLPGGATLDNGTGVITWTPDCSAAAGGTAGTYGPFALTATAGTGETGASNAFSIHVTDTPVAVSAVTGLGASQVLTGNGTSGRTSITLHFTVPSNASAVEIYRAPFGDYPEYSEGTGAAPAQPTTWPPASVWQLTAVTADGGLDLPATRDFWYYVAYAKNACDNHSVASTMTSGTLDYHLGDVSDGAAAGSGDNQVNDLDISLLGYHYGISGPAVLAYNYLDVGPTSTMARDGRPVPDDEIGFEDLIVFAMNYSVVSVPAANVKVADLTPASSDGVVLERPDRVVEGLPVTARLMMQGTGTLRALSAHLVWDPAIVEPVSMARGDWLLSQNGVAFSPKPGTVDAAVLQTSGMTGEGELASVTFRVLAAGDPKISILALDGRDARNGKISVASSARAAVPTIPNVTRMAPISPNPFSRTTTIAFSLARSGPVEVAIFSVDGRRVRMLARGAREPGEYQLVWDGHDDSGNPVSAGAYYARLVAPQARFTRMLVYLK